MCYKKYHHFDDFPVQERLTVNAWVDTSGPELTKDSMLYKQIQDRVYQSAVSS